MHVFNKEHNIPVIKGIQRSLSPRFKATVTNDCTNASRRGLISQCKLINSCLTYKWYSGIHWYNHIHAVSGANATLSQIFFLILWRCKCKVTDWNAWPLNALLWGVSIIIISTAGVFVSVRVRKLEKCCLISPTRLMSD